MDLTSVLSALTRPVGVSGLEHDAAKVAAELLAPYAKQVTVTPRGSVIGTICEKPGTPHLLLDAHIDEIGMMVSKIEPDGLLRCVPVGGLDLRLLCGQPVIIHGIKEIPAVVVTPKAEKEPKALKAEELLLDAGFSAASDLDGLVSVGDRATVDDTFLTLQGGRVSSRALDDRAGVAAILYALSLLEEEPPCSLSVLFSSQEEVGLLGAETDGFRIHPTHAIAVDVSFAHTPDAPEEKCGKLDGGGMIGFAPILDHKLSRRLQALAEQEGIPYQNEVMGGRTGTNLDAISLLRGGVCSGLISIPLRYMHTSVELLSLSDLEAVSRLLAAAVRKAGDLLC